MDLHKALVHLDSRNGAVSVDGTRLKSVRAVTIRGSVDEVPSITVYLRLDSALVDGDYTVQVPDDTATTLTALGWTPPAPSS